MRSTKLLTLFAAALLALTLAGCGGGQAAEELPAGEVQSHTFSFDGNVVQVSVDVSGGFSAAFDEDSADLYDGSGDGGQEDPVACAVYESEADYQAQLAIASSYPSFTTAADGVTFTDSVGVQDRIIDLGDGVYCRIMVTPELDGEAIFQRFSARLVESAPSDERDSLYLTLVNRTHKLPAQWEDRIELLEAANYSGETIRVERTAYDAFQALRTALLAEGVDIELESCYRSVERQTELWAEYEELYGLDYCRQYVAVPGFSEHHTGFAIDATLVQPESQASEEERQAERARLWDQVHRKLPEYGFILRYLAGKEDITGYSYEPWHLRYVGDPALAREIAARGLTLEEYLGQVEPSDATVDYGVSGMFTREEMAGAVAALRAEFDTWTGCQLHSVRYAGDGCCTPENLAWMKSLGEGKNYTACIAFYTDFRSPAENSGALDPDAAYINYPWWLARTMGGDWELVTCGY